MPPLDTRDPLLKAVDRAAHQRAIDEAVAAERQRCAMAVVEVLREISAKPGSSIDSTCRLINERIVQPELQR